MPSPLFDTTVFSTKDLLLHFFVKRRTWQGLYHIMARDVEKVLEVLVASAEQGPDRAGALVDVAGLSLTSIVAQERAVQT